MTAVDNLIAELQQNRRSANVEPIICDVDTFIAALQQLVAGGGSGTVTNFSFTNGSGFSGNVTNPTTTPALALSVNLADCLARVSSNALAAVTIGSGLTFVGGTLSATGTGGTVTNVSATDGNGFDFTVTNPTTTPDISLAVDSSLNNKILYSNAGALTGVTIGSGLTFSGGTLDVAASGGATYLVATAAPGAATASSFTHDYASNTGRLYTQGAGAATYRAIQISQQGSGGANEVINLSISATTNAVTLRGTNTNDDAAAGFYGEYLTANQTTPQSLTTNTPLNITSLSLTAGDWDVSGVVQIGPSGTTALSRAYAGVSSVSATLTAPNYQLVSFGDSGISSAGGTNATQNIAAPVTRFSLASTTTIYLVAQANFGVSTAAAIGWIRARRVR